MLRRTLGIRLARETIRKIKKRALVPDREVRRRRARRIDVDRPRQLWGADLTLVWVLGFFPVWLLGVVDYHGSRLVALERVRWPTAHEVERVMRDAIAREGPPERLLTDNGGQFCALSFELMLADLGIEHTRTKPAHPWTNGRIERLFRTFEETVHARIWMFSGPAQIDRFALDFVRFYNRDRPHSRFGGRTPNEVFFGRPEAQRPLGRAVYFDGLMPWYRFG